MYKVQPIGKDWFLFIKLGDGIWSLRDKFESIKKARQHAYALAEELGVPCIPYDMNATRRAK